MFHTARHHQHVTGTQQHVAIAEFHAELAAMHEEQFILIGMRMPVEGALEPGQLHVLSVQLGHDARVPVIGEGRKFLVERDAVIHGIPSA